MNCTEKDFGYGALFAFSLLRSDRVSIQCTEVVGVDKVWRYFCNKKSVFVGIIVASFYFRIAWPCYLRKLFE